MKFVVRPELPTAALRSSQATHAAVDNSAPSAIRTESTFKSGKVVQTRGATSGEDAPDEEQEVLVSEDFPHDPFPALLAGAQMKVATTSP